MFHQLNRDVTNATKNSRGSSKVSIDETRSACPDLESFCQNPKGAEAIEALTKISARVAVGGSDMPSLSCGVCGSVEQLHGCLESVFVGCWKHTREYLSSKGLTLAMDLDRGVIYSAKMGDYIYDGALTPAMALLRRPSHPILRPSYLSPYTS